MKNSISQIEDDGVRLTPGLVIRIEAEKLNDSAQIKTNEWRICAEGIRSQGDVILISEILNAIENF